MTTNLSDTTTWLPLDGLAPGFDASRAPLSPALRGRTFTTVAEDGARSACTITADTEVFEVDDALFYVEFGVRDDPDEARSLVLDLRGGHALSIVSRLRTPGAGTTAVGQTFTALRIDGVEPTAPAPAPTNELLGRRVLWVYSEHHAYEHVYLSPHWYSWHCLAGPERGLADTDEVSMWQLRPGIHVFAWREKVIPCGSVTIADHRSAHALRSHGMLFGLAENGIDRTHFTFGARGRLLSTTAHPPAFDPYEAAEAS
ncbi:MoaF C-terminal domain-containing protein [Microbacterium hominis]|uniref:MoaF N-terminal domain-containing protein n=1 Tax=Microbacterium hominis TaxID=162426 RepID=A0A7D4QKI0_9MICO|nr:MoaF C-terminal domain-containing protein [Microbacterium hominis]QKJ20476.1 MoaF N-terminal domain-containing protein [Microbacterium hominis]